MVHRVHIETEVFPRFRVVVELVELSAPEVQNAIELRKLPGKAEHEVMRRTHRALPEVSTVHPVERIVVRHDVTHTGMSRPGISPEPAFQLYSRVTPRDVPRRRAARPESPP